MEFTQTEKDLLIRLVTRKIEKLSSKELDEFVMQEIQVYKDVLSKLKDKEGLDDSVIF